MPPAQFLDGFAGGQDPSPISEHALGGHLHSIRTPSTSLHPSTMHIPSLSRHAQMRKRHTWDLVAGLPRDEPFVNLSDSTPGIGLENMANPLFLLPHRSTAPPVALGYRLPFIILAALTGVIVLAGSISVAWYFRGKTPSKLRMLRLKAKSAEKTMSWSMMRSNTSTKADEKMEGESVLKRVTVVLDRMAQPEGAFRNEKYAVLQPQFPPLAVLRHDVPGTRHRRRSLAVAETQRRLKTVASSALPRLPSLAPSPALFTISEDEERRAAEKLLQSPKPPGLPKSSSTPNPSTMSQAQKPGSRSTSMTMGLGFIAGMANVIIDAASTSLASLSSLESIDLADQVYDGIEPPSTSKSASQTPFHTLSMPETISFASTPTPSASESHSYMTDGASLLTPSLESDLAGYQVQHVQKFQRLSGELRRASLISFPEVALEGSKHFPSVVVTTSPSIAEVDVRRASMALEMAAASSQSSTATASTYACLDDFPAPPTARMSLSDEIESSLPGSLGWKRVLSASDPDLTRSAAEEKGREKEAGFAKLVRASDPPRLSGLGLGLSFLR